MKLLNKQLVLLLTNLISVPLYASKNFFPELSGWELFFFIIAFIFFAILFFGGPFIALRCLPSRRWYFLGLAVITIILHAVTAVYLVYNQFFNPGTLFILIFNVATMVGSIFGIKKRNIRV